MTYGTIKVDTVTFTDAGVDKSVTLSGLVQNPTFSGNVTVTGTLSGVTVTGTTANFTSGNFTNISGGTHTITSGVFAAGSAASPSITFTGDLNTGIYSPGADQVAISTGGSGRLFVNASGNIGVGANNAQNYSGFTNIAINGTQGGAIDLCASAVGVGANRVAQLSGINGGSFVLATGAADTMVERLRITSAGLVGVGTSSPSNKLNVVAPPSASGVDGIALNNGTRDAISLYVTGSSYSYGSIGSTQTWLYANEGDLNITNDATGVIKFSGDLGVERMRIDAQGRVGVGTTSPGRTLDVAGTIRSTTGVAELDNATQFKLLSFHHSGTRTGVVSYDNTNNWIYINAEAASSQMLFGTAGSERLRIDSSGRVGIGTSSPGNAAHIRGINTTTNFTVSNISGLLTLQDTSTAAGAGARIAFGCAYSGTNSTGQAIIGASKEPGEGTGSDQARSSLVFHTSNAASGVRETMRLDPDGRLGIGTTSPGVALDVNGITRTSSYFSANDNGYIRGDTAGELRIQPGTNGTVFRNASNSAEYARIDSSGRLLVGTSSARGNFFNSTVSPLIQQEGISGSGRFMSVTYGTASEDDPIFILGKHRGASIGGNTIVANGDGLGKISFQGSDGSELVEGAAIRAEVDGTPGANDMPGRLVFSTTRDGQSSPEEKIRVTNDGHTIFKPTTGNSTITLANNDTAFTPDASYGQALRFGNTYGGGKGFCNFTTNGTLVGTIQANGTTGTTYATTSDYRLKENVKLVADGIIRLQQLKPSRFNFIADPDRTVDGFIAHEVQAIVPEAITGEKDAVDDNGNPVYQGIDQSKLVPLLTAALQEVVAEINALKDRVAALEGV